MAKVDPSRLHRAQEAEAFFRDNLGIVHCVLTSPSLYKLPGKDAEELEGYLSEWFGFFVLRYEIRRIPIDRLRLPLLISTCRVGCVAALCKLGENPCLDPKLKDILEADPEGLARLIEEKLRLGLRPDAVFP